MKKNRRILKIFLVSAVLATVFFFTAPHLANFLIVEKILPEADAILVLGGSAVYEERCAKAAELYKNGKSKKIFLTDDGRSGGWSQTEQRNPKFVERARKKLIQDGVLPEHIFILEPEVDGTIDEARLLKEKSEAENINSIVIVTSAYHSRRALWIFEKISAEKNVLIGIETAPPGIQTPLPEEWIFSIDGWRFVAGEYVKFVVYRLFY